MIREACVGNYIEAKRAYINGADRIELCDNLGEGGTTPSYGTIKKSVKDVHIPINVIIRPRGGDFIYSDEEFEIMKEDIKLCKQSGVNGVVFGILNSTNEIDINRTRELVTIAEGLSITFHMAFDEIDDKYEAIDELIELGVDRILTKGGEVSAIENLQELKRLIKYADNRIIIMPGGGVNKDNIDLVIDSTGAKELHGTKIV